MNYLRALYQCRELAPAVLRLASHDTLCSVQKATRPGLAIVSHASDDVSSRLAQVALLVLRDLEEPEGCLGCAPTEAGMQVARLLQSAVFGEDSMDVSFMQCVYLGSLTQARAAQQLCVAVLLDLVSTQTCLSLYSLAATCGCGALHTRARQVALEHFAEACSSDHGGLVGLADAELMALLCSDELVVGSEMESFHGLVTWVEHDPAMRMQRFATRLALAVRLTQVDLSDLAFMDAHPLVGGCRMAISLVAHAYLSKLMGVQHASPFGMESIGRPRRCQLSPGPPTPAVQLAANGRVAQDSAPGSAVEAAVRALTAQQRRVGRAHQQLAQAAVPAVGPVQPPPVSQQAVPSSPPAMAAAGVPTPTNAALARAAPKLQAASRARLFGTAHSSGSRRSLFSSACDRRDGTAAICRQQQDGGAGSGVEFEMALSPRVRLEEMAGQEEGDTLAGDNDWRSRKRLRFQ